MRILQVIDDMGRNSGVSSMLLNYYKFIEHRDIHFDFMVYHPVPEEVRIYCKNHHSRIFEVGPLSGKTVLSGTLSKRITQVFKKYAKSYDIIHGHESNTAFIYMKLAKQYGIRIRILHSHNAKGADGLAKKARNFVLNREGLKYVTHYCACSKKAALYLYGTDRHVNIVNNAIDTEQFRFCPDTRNRVRKRLGLENQFVVGHVGRFAPQKNHSYIIDIFYRFHRKVKNSTLILLGDGVLMEEVKKKVCALHLEEAVQFAGVQDHVNEYMQAMDAFILPSRYEGLPVVCVEAQAAGLKCLVSREVTREIIITDNVKLLGIGKKDIDLWVSQLMKIREKNALENRARYAALVADKGFDIKRQSKRLERYYHFILHDTK